MREIWKDIMGYEGLYQVSNLGRVKKLQSEYTDTWGTGRHRIIPERIVSCNVAKMGYYMIDLWKDKHRKRCYVHRLVAQAFIPNPNNLPCVNHKDEDKLNNCIDNLEWCTYGYNNSYGTNRSRMVETRRLNGTYDNLSDITRKRISEALLGKKKSALHRKHISEGRKSFLSTNHNVGRMVNI